MPHTLPLARLFQSVGFTPAAFTRTSTSVGPGTGLSTSTIFSTSGPPAVSWLIARIFIRTSLLDAAALGE